MLGKIPLLLFLLLPTYLFAASPDEVAIEIIRADGGGGYNMLEDTKEERLRFAAGTYRYFLNGYMRSEEIPERIKISYALRLIDEKVPLLANSSLEADLKNQRISELKEKQIILIHRLAEIYEEQRHNQSVDTTAANAHLLEENAPSKSTNQDVEANAEAAVASP